MTHLRINRRNLLTGTVALGTVGLLRACGGGSDKKISGRLHQAPRKSSRTSKSSRTAPPSSRVASSAVACSAVGPNFNIWTQSGYTTENPTASVAPATSLSAIGFTSSPSPAGEYSLNDYHVSDYKAETVGGVQTITFKLNSGLSSRDGTPADVEGIRAAWTVYRNPDDGYNVIALPFWQQVASIDPVDGDKTRVKIVSVQAPVPR